MASALEATVTLPFEPEFIDEGNDCYNNVESCALYRMLPANARDYVKASPHLLEYLHILPVNTVGIPLFLSELKRDLKSMENPNIIYPVNETTFIHIFPDPNDVRNWYIPIEPSFLHSVKEILPVIEEKLIDMIDALDEEPVTEQARIGVLKNFIQQLVYIKQPGEVIDESLLAGGTPKDLMARIKTFLTSEIGAPKQTRTSGHQELADGRIVLTQQEYKALEYMIVRDKIEMGTLKPFLSDKYIEDITCDGVGPIFIEHKIFKGLKSVIGFRDSQELDNFVIKLAERIKRPLTYRNPIVDSTLPDGSRINIVYGTEISKHGSNFTIRKVNEVPLSILQVIESGACNYMMAAYLWICLEYGMSLFVSGETASGKTTTLNALTTFIPPENKIVTIE
ncbi:MAG: archaeal flagellar protein FlaI, partial [Euryarchaeota archaeon]|nr:archaeal flagellar protein FlaI [Euryarchaeota archaeon]